MGDQRPSGSSGRERDTSQEELRQQLIAELEALVERLKATAPDFIPPRYSRRRLLDLGEELLGRFLPERQSSLVGHLRAALNRDFLDPETWKGLWYLTNYTVRLQADFVKRRFTGAYETDEWGLDWEFVETVLPFINFLYAAYWRIETTGVERIPLEGPALLVSNHSGQLPWDALMLGAAVWNEHPAQRVVRALYDSWYSSVPFVSALAMKMGYAPATVENGTRLLLQGELVASFPEGYEGLRKLYTQRYRLSQFGRGGFVRMALAAQAPIIPVAVVGAEETYLSLAHSQTLARLTGLPYFTISLTFPWLGLLGLVPLPSKWYIDFGAPISVDSHGENAAANLMLVARLTEETRSTVQAMLQTRLAARSSVFH
jgi:1-acyl-sn-glycerol-3-phosphate acyltransferase